MPVTLRPVNTGSLSALKTTLLQLRPAAQPVLHTIGRAFPIDSILPDTPQQSFPLYTLGLNSITNPQLQLNAAKPSGWLHLLNNEVSATVGNAAPNGQSAVPALSSGPLAQALSQLFPQLSSNGQLAATTYEATLLYIPALYTYAFWLKTGTPATEDDLLMVVLSDQLNLTKGKMYTVPAFFAALQAPATSLLQQSDDLM